LGASSIASLEEHARTAVCLWIVHSHFINAADTSPILLITSPVRQSGKTRLLEALELLTRNGLLTPRTTAAALVRMLDEDKPTLLLDESDQLWKASGEYVAAITQS
jgi:putative DNA primase/helicase